MPFVFSQYRRTYYLAHAAESHELRTRAELQQIAAHKAAWVFDALCTSLAHDSHRLTELLGHENSFGTMSFDSRETRAQLAQIRSGLWHGGQWTLFARDMKPKGLLALPEQIAAEAPADQTFGWIEFDLLDQADVPLAGVPWALKDGDEVLRSGVFGALGNVYVDGIDPGTYKIVIGAPREEPVAQDDGWLGITMLDQAGAPMAGEPFVVIDAAGKRHEGTLDAGGRGVLLGLTPGDCTVSFTRLHPDAWDME
jgi:hypothetical protein